MISWSASCRSVRRALSLDPFSMALEYFLAPWLVFLVGFSSRLLTSSANSTRVATRTFSDFLSRS